MLGRRPDVLGFHGVDVVMATKTPPTMGFARRRQYQQGGPTIETLHAAQRLSGIVRRHLTMVMAVTLRYTADMIFAGIANVLPNQRLMPS